MNNFFSTTDMGGPPKITVSSVGGVLSPQWDREDPELIAAGINDLTDEEWSYVMSQAELYFQSLPTIKITDEGRFIQQPGSTEWTKMDD